MASQPATPKLYQAIIAALQADITAGRYVPGDRLPPERALVERFAVSRLTVREAMIGMEILGLVEARRGSGVYVTERPSGGLAASELDVGAFELIEARRLIEGESAALAAVTADEAAIARLRATLDAMIEENKHDLQDETADRAFHFEIARATNNAAMVLVIETLWDVRHRSPLCERMLARSRAAGIKPMIDDHRAILDAIAAHDGPRARQAMRGHLGRVIDNLLEATELDGIRRVQAEAAELRTRAERLTAF
ncbi:MAG TPA: FadR/GntR family transcriptional regulator [Sphingomonas sp.]|nr:FadR/GntR family transcriptional regulator [Sphingomonas sp.]